jgi:hypothetical protein
MNGISPTLRAPVAPLRAEGDLWLSALTGFWTMSAGVLVVAGLVGVLAASF